MLDGGTEGIVVRALASTGLLEGSGESNEEAGVAQSQLDAVVVGTLTATGLANLGDRALEGSDSITHEVLGIPENVVVGGNKSLGEDGDIQFRGSFLDTLKDDVRLHVGSMTRFTDRFDLVRVMLLKRNRDNGTVGGRRQVSGAGSLDLVTEGTFQVGVVGSRVVVAALATAGLLDGSSQDGLVVIVAALATAGLLDGCHNRNEESVVLVESETIIVTALATAGLLDRRRNASLEGNRISRHVVTEFPVGIVVGRNERRSDNIQIVGGRFTDHTVQDDFRFEEVVGGDLVFVLRLATKTAEGVRVGRSSEEGKGNESRKLHRGMMGARSRFRRKRKGSEIEDRFAAK